MRFRRYLLPFPAVLLLAMPSAAADCALVTVPAPMLAGGLSEPLGDLILQCSFGAPGTSLSGFLVLSVDRKLSNAIDGENRMSGIAVAVGDTAPAPLPGIVARSSDGMQVIVDGVATTFDVNGKATLRVSGLRASTAPQVRAQLGFAGTPYLSINPPSVIAGYGVDSFLATTPDTLLQPNSGGLDGVDLTPYIAKMDPNLTVRLTESDVAAFHSRLSGDTTGTRIALRFPALPAGSRVFAPDAIAGSNADAPTHSGWFGSAPEPGTYTLYTPVRSSLLLVRVKTAEPDGTGGSLAWQPVAGINPLAGLPVREADYAPDGSPYLIYEVADAHSQIQESAQIPVYAFAGPTSSNGRISARATVQLAPVPAPATLAKQLPSPRYSDDQASGPDCPVLLDCTAKWFPELRLQAVSVPSRTMQSDSGTQQGFLRLTNVGGGVALWQGRVEYERGARAWLRLGMASGATANQVGITYNFAPVGLWPGTYRATLIFTLTNAPDGSRPTVTQPVQLTVTPKVPHPRRVPPAH